MSNKCRLCLVTILILVISLFVGCIPKIRQQVITDDSTDKQKLKIDSLEFVSGSVDGSWIKIAAGISEKTNEYFEGFPILASPGGSIMNPLVVSEGKASIGMSYAPFLVMGKEGIGPYDKPITNLRSIASLTPTVFHFLANTSLKVNSVYELVEKKIPVVLGLPSKSDGSNYITQIIFSELGYDDIEGIKEYGSEIFYGDGGALEEAWKDRYIDVDIMTYNVPTLSIQEALTIREGKLLNIDKKVIDVLVNEKAFNKYTIPAGTYPGQEKDVETVSLKIVVFVREDIPEDIVYNLTKAIYENKLYFEGIHSSFKDFYPEKMTEGLGIEMHKGAEKFYREVSLIK